MLNLDGKYGNVHINGMSIDIEKTEINKLDKYLKELEIQRARLIDEQNNYLSQIIG